MTGLARSIGVDVGGTGVKGGLVDLVHGVVLGEVVKLATPNPAVVDDVVAVIADVVARVSDAKANVPMPLGVALSSDVRDGRHTSGVSLHPSWIGAAARDLIEETVGAQVSILNDADAAAIGEGLFGAAADVPGVVIVLTFGTGIGSGILHDGRLLPNSGLGQLPFRGAPAEQLISAVQRERRGMSWKRWAPEVSAYLVLVDELLRPDLIVIGGGVVHAQRSFWDLLEPPCPIRLAALGNEAGIVGAAAYAASLRAP